MNDKIVMPGDRLSTSEELLPGEGTFEEDGVIRAARVGKFLVNKKYMSAEVKPVTSIPVLIKKGDIVIAKVDSVKSSMLIAEVLHVVGKNRGISGDTSATLHVSEIARGYVKEPATEFGVGDYFRAKVFQVKPSIQITTKDGDLGAIKSLCTKCRNPLVKKGNILECENCGNKQKRRIATDYGEIDLNKL
ncbi:MAG: exosome complex RNA-binding protein Csl4 [Thermoplasmatales archaeon]|nr:MAG: exosome complex RNA-binding protein Csl4 [Thermoplasmatales archaeon]